MEKINYAEKEMIPLTHEENDTHFILEQLAKELKGELNCIGDNMRISLFQSQLKKKLIMMMVMMVKKKKAITCKLKFIDRFGFMPTSLSELADNTFGIFNSTECKSCKEKIKINSKFCFVGLKNNKLIYKCKECKEEWKRPLNKLIESFPSIYQF